MALVALAIGSLACQGNRVPPSPMAHATDLANVLTPAVLSKLDTDLDAYETHTKHQVWVWISDRGLSGVPIEDFCFNTFNAWGVGRAGFDDGVVVFLFPREKPRLRMRIQVGYGLERALPDAECVRILRQFGPELESTGNYDKAVLGIVSAIVTRIEATK